MKQWNILFFILSFVLLVACTDDEGRNRANGKMKVNLTTNNEIVDVTTRTLGDNEFPDVSEFSIAVLMDGKTVNKWDKFSDYSQDDITFPVGGYTLVASYGDEEKEGFGLPYYKGTADFVIKGGETTDVETTCTLANTKISISYTDDFKSYFKTYTPTVKSEEGSEVTFASDETRAAYVKPGRVAVSLTFTKVNGGLSATTIEVTTIEALAQHHYHVLMDVDAGKAILSIMFDRVTEEKPVTLDISDKALNIKAPYFTLTGFEKTSNDENKWEGNLTESSKLSALLTSLGGFKKCTFKAVSPNLPDWPQEGYDLANLSEKDKEELTGMGFKLTGFGANKDQMAIIDFTGVVPNLNITDANSEHLFYLQVTSTYGKVSEKYVLNLTTPKNFMLLPAEAVKMKSSEVTIPVKLKEGDPNLIKLKYKYYGVMTEIKSTEITPIADKPGYYNIKAKNIDMGFVAKDFQAEYNGVKSAIVSIPVIVPQYSVELPIADVWSYSLTMTIKPEDATDLNNIMSAIEPYFSLDGSSWTKIDAQHLNIDLNMGKVEVSNLMAGRTYYFKTTCDDGGAFSEVLDRTMEGVFQLDDFTQGWTSLFTGTINKGGGYGKNQGILGGLTPADKRQDTQSLTVNDINTIWATVNKKTVPTAPKVKNTWYMVPSTFLQEDGVLLRNVAWSDKLDAPPSKYNNYSSGMSSLTDLDAPKHEHKSVGKLFLGSYKYDHNTQTEEYIEGIELTSRPIKLTGTYTYKADGDEGGIVTVVVEDREGGQSLQLASKEVVLYPTTVEKEFVVPLVYTITNKKATHLRVMFASSSKASNSQSEEDSNIKTTDYKSEAVARGSELYISKDIKLEYK